MSSSLSQPIDALRKQPRQARAWRTIVTLFEATAQILTQEGEAALTTNRIAERAGFSIGTLYQYFPSLDALLLAMIDVARRRVVRELHELLTEAETSTDSPALFIGRYIETLMTAFSGGDAAQRALLKRGWRMDDTPPVIALTQETAERVRQAFIRRAHPEFPPPDDVTLFVVTRAVLGVIRATVQEDSPLTATPILAATLTTMAVAMLRTPAVNAAV